MTSYPLLNVTQKSRRRIFVGLGWDPNDVPTLKDKVGSLIGSREVHHDLDLSCYYYNQDSACLGFVSAAHNNNQNVSGSIYHSGDSVEGVGDGDDEQISAELLKLPPNIHHLIFKAHIKSGHVFDEIAAPEIRLCDGYTGRSFLESSLCDGQQSNSFVFARVYRGQDLESWHLHEIKTYWHDKDVEDWQETLRQYL